MRNNLLSKKWLWLIPLILGVMVIVMLFNHYKNLPEGLSMEGSVHHVDEVEFLQNLSYKKDRKPVHDQQIFQKAFKMIEQAQHFVVVDMFLLNSYTDESRDFPKLADQLTEKLIAQKKKHPDMQAVLITDPINAGYHSYEDKHLKKLEANGVEVVVTNLDKLRDSNPAYSAFWRIFMRPFGQAGEGWLPNPLASGAPKITARSYALLLNVKANHRKVFVTEKEALVTSGNAHDASGYFSNVGFAVKGDIIHEIVEAEQAVIDYSGGKTKVHHQGKVKSAGKGDIAVQYLTEGKIEKHVLQALDHTKKGDEIDMAMFYLAERAVVDRLKEAEERGVKVRLILDPNKIAFGHGKTGLPNLPIARELKKHGGIGIRWYDSNKNQFHTKMMFIKQGKRATVIGGSANFTARNLGDLNLESDLKIEAPLDKPVMKDIDQYFDRIWNNKGGKITADYSKYENDLTPLLEATYWVQKATGLTTY
ncbi:phospholipase D family protein [Aciduricibacillus chroicocephali]|uniref:phospholipase D n=1 Tax=Aciduricibacillus chroicocephali TaxID=3054939 RepID=A0ABY9KUA3_9BACI|nr:phospholipase D family protein [Bacillaceae bacterium 44XB]